MMMWIVEIENKRKKKFNIIITLELNSNTNSEKQPHHILRSERTETSDSRVIQKYFYIQWCEQKIFVLNFRPFLLLFCESVRPRICRRENGNYSVIVFFFWFADNVHDIHFVVKGWLHCKLNKTNPNYTTKKKFLWPTIIIEKY